jgi:hypothetical protein
MHAHTYTPTFAGIVLVSLQHVCLFACIFVFPEPQISCRIIFFQATSNLLRQELGGGEREGGILCNLIMYFGFLIINLV